MTTPNTAPRSPTPSPPPSRRRGSTSRSTSPTPSNATDVQSQVLQLKEKKPDVVLMISYTSDAILFAKTMQAQDYKPPHPARRRRRLFRSVLHQGGRQDLARRVQPLVLERRTRRLADRYHRRHVQEEERRRDGRHRRAADDGPLRADRRHRPRRLDRAGKDPGGAEGDRPQARPAHDRLQGRQVRRQGPEHPGLRRASSSCRTARTTSRSGRRPVPRRRRSCRTRAGNRCRSKRAGAKYPAPRCALLDGNLSLATTRGSCPSFWCR